MLQILAGTLVKSWLFSTSMLTSVGSHVNHVAPNVVAKSITTILPAMPGSTLVHHLLACHYPFSCSFILSAWGGDMRVHHSRLALRHFFRVPLRLEMVIMMGRDVLILVHWNGAAQQTGD